MKPAPFEYLRAATLAEALAARAAHGDDAMVLAGGQSLVPAMNFRLACPAVLIDIGRLGELAFARRDAATGALHLGARTRHRDLIDVAVVGATQPLLAETAPHIAHPQIRNRGTLGGNLAHADPASELPAVMLALGARLKLASTSGERWVAAPAFFRGICTTACRDDEILTEVALPPLPAHSGTAFLEMARRPGDFALAGVVCVVTLDPAGAIAVARIALCGVGETPVSACEAEALLAGEVPAPAAFATAANAVATAITPLGSVHAAPDFQRHLARVLTCRALAIAAGRAAKTLEAAA